MKPGTIIVTAFLAFVSIAQLIRVVFQIEVVANGVVIPVWPSAIACIVTGVLAIMLWRENLRR
jgi:hypothetical protein